MKNLALAWMLAFLAAATGAQQPAAHVAAEVRTPDEPVTVEQLTQEALQRNPGVQAALHRVLALRHRIPQAKALPDPTVSVGWMGNAQPFSVQTGDPSSYRSVGAMQEIPFPGKRGLRGEVADKEAQAAWWDYEAARRQLVAEVKTAYYEYFYYEQAARITERNHELLQKLSQIAEARYRVGKAIQADVLKSQTELSMVTQRLTVLEQQRDGARAQLNALLARAAETPLPAAAAPAQPNFTYTLDKLYALAAANDAGVAREQQLIERSRKSAALAHRELYPDFGVGYMYQQRPAMPDMHGLTFSVSIPVFSKGKQDEAVKEANEEELAARSEQQERRNRVQAEIKQQYLAATAAQKLYALSTQGVVPQSSLALQSSLAAYQVGTADFLTVLTNFSSVLQYEVDAYRQMADYQIALARMEPLVGIDLTEAPAAPAPKQ